MRAEAHISSAKFAKRKRRVPTHKKGRSSMYKKILLAFDGSPDGREALTQAEALASACDATVHLLAIIDSSESMVIVGAMSHIPANQRFVIRSVLDEGMRRLRRAGCAATNEIKYGRPAEQIVLSAKEIGANLIVVGHRDQGTLARWLNGSVGESIVHQPPCSVLIAVKPEQPAISAAPIQQLKARVKDDSS